MNEKEYDYIIIGAGPAGIQLGYYFENTDKNYIILEKNKKAGSFFMQYPRHRKLISINKVNVQNKSNDFKLRHDWNSLLSDYHNHNLLLKQYTNKYYPNANSYVKYLNNYCKRFNIKINFGTTVNSISKINDKFIIYTDEIIYKTKTLIIGTGLSKENIPNIKGKEYITTYGKMSLNHNKYKNKNVCIIGIGNSGLETANHLLGDTNIMHMFTRKLDKNLSWSSHYPGDIRSINNAFIDSYLLKSQNVIDRGFNDSYKIKKIDDKLILVDQTNNSLLKKKYDYIISCTGFRFDNSIFHKNIKPKLFNNVPHLKNDFSSINVPNLYFIGVLMQHTDYKKSSGAFIHGFRYYIRSLFRIIEYEKHNKLWPSKKINTLKNLTDYIFERINTSSGMYQDFGFLCDIVVINDNDFIYYFEVPLKYIPNFKSINNKNYIIISLNYGGKLKHNFFKNIITTDPNNSHNSKFLHPIITYYSNGKKNEVLHILEDVNTEWHDFENHKLPLIKFFERNIGYENKTEIIETFSVVSYKKSYVVHILIVLILIILYLKIN